MITHAKGPKARRIFPNLTGLAGVRPRRRPYGSAHAAEGCTTHGNSQASARRSSNRTISVQPPVRRPFRGRLIRASSAPHGRTGPRQQWRESHRPHRFFRILSWTMSVDAHLLGLGNQGHAQPRLCTINTMRTHLCLF